jgi:hypothetical protein
MPYCTPEQARINGRLDEEKERNRRNLTPVGPTGKTVYNNGHITLTAFDSADDVSAWLEKRKAISPKK